MKSIFRYCCVSFFLINQLLNAQSTTVVWLLTSDDNPQVSGYAQAAPVIRSNMVVRSYSTSTTDGTYQKNGPDSGGNWIAESSENPNRYMAYAFSAQEGYTFVVSTVSLRIGYSGSSSLIKANIYYSTDSTNNFASRTLLESGITVQNSAFSDKVYPVQVTISGNQQFYLLIFPWATSATSSKSVSLQNVTISGSASVLGSGIITVSPTNLSYGTINVNAFKIKDFVLNAWNLQPAEGNLVLSAPQGFALSESRTGMFVRELLLPYQSGVVENTRIYVRFEPTTTSAFSSSLSISGGGAAQVELHLNGTAVPVDSILGIFVALNGNDSNIGSFNAPFATIAKAVSVAQPGDTIFLRGGVYNLTSTVTLSKNGSDELRYYLKGYPNDSQRPLLNFSSMQSGDGINLTGSYWFIKGIDVCRAPGNGMRISGSYNIVEYCSFFENKETGLQISNGGSYNRIINSDSYFNYDPPLGGNADGFAPKLSVGTGNYFYGCRAWQNSDDGWDGYLRDNDNVITILEYCWSFMNGYLMNGNPITTGNGNGFKMGGGDNSNADSLRHHMTLKNCLAFDNRVKGFDQNNNRGSMIIYNGTAYRNYTNYGMGSRVKSGETMTLVNCVALGSTGSVWSGAIQKTNSWMSPFTPITAAEFVSTDTTGIRGPRKPDGSLPDVPFMRLLENSKLIDVGTFVGTPYNGNAADLGCFEYGTVLSVDKKQTMIPGKIAPEQNYPNPFNPVTVIPFRLSTTSHVILSVYDILGREVACLLNKEMVVGNYEVPFEATQLPSGVCIVILKTGNKQLNKKMLLLK